MCSVFLGLLGQCSLFLWGGSCDPEPIGQAEKWGLETSQECSINKSILILLTTPSFMICCGEMPGGWGYPHLKWMGRNQKEMELKLKWLVFTHHNQKCTAWGKQHSNPAYDSLSYDPMSTFPFFFAPQRFSYMIDSCLVKSACIQFFFRMWLRCIFFIRKLSNLISRGQKPCTRIFQA